MQLQNDEAKKIENELSAFENLTWFLSHTKNYSIFYVILHFCLHKFLPILIFLLLTHKHIIKSYDSFACVVRMCPNCIIVIIESLTVCIRRWRDVEREYT